MAANRFAENLQLSVSFVFKLLLYCFY